jgi:hypothetical protein
MEIGMLWFDNDKQASTPTKVERAALYYQKKYGVNPDLCYVHPKMVVGQNEPMTGSKQNPQGDQIRIGQVLVLKNEKILPDHFWIGVSTGGDRVS